MDIVERATEILRHPDNEWAAVQQEQSSMQDLIIGYVAPLAAIPAIAGLLGTTIIGFAGYKPPLIAAIFHAVIGYVVDVIAIYALAHFMTWLAPRFGAKGDLSASFQVAVYSFTPIWVCGVVGLIPALGLLILAGELYAIYLMSIGAERILGVPKDKTLSYATIAVTVSFTGLVILHHLLAAMGGAPRLL
jgi:hypothetical protein